MQRVDVASFEQEVLKSDLPVVVDFYADWCGPCKRMEPVLEKVSQAYGGKVKVVKLNSDENQDLSLKYQVRGLPTLILFRAGEEVDRKLGFQNEQDLNKLMTTASA
ncbi:MAG: thioredoxin [Candidatus Eremiobacteraeota bacterium]|nr:thioredoxin [Candidatus Eremiobacteraeota bacterium]